jgi:hypothetical protein
VGERGVLIHRKLDAMRPLPNQLVPRNCQLFCVCEGGGGRFGVGGMQERVGGSAQGGAAQQSGRERKRDVPPIIFKSASLLLFIGL